MSKISILCRNNNFFKRLKSDLQFRRRFRHTVCLLWVFIGLGWAVGQMGPSFPDLRLIADVDLDTASWLFTVFAFGYMTGSLFGGIMYGRFNKALLVAISVVSLGIFTGLTPWCKWFPLMLTVKFISGLGAGGIDTGGNADVVSLWDADGGTYMQALHFCFGLGGIVSPVATEPFLAKTECATDYQDVWDSAGNTSHPSTNVSTCKEVYGNSNVYYAYLITVILVCSGSVPFFIFSKGSNNKRHNKDTDGSNLPQPSQLPTKQKILFLTLLSFTFLTYCAIEDTFSGYLATFCINYFKWDSGKSSFATSLHWASFSVGRFLGIFIINYFKPAQLLITYLVLLVLSFVGFLITSLTYMSEIFWIFIALPGFAMSVIFPCLFTWTEANILKVSGLISGIFLIAASSGLMINPLFLGFLMDNKSPIWFAYVLFGESCLCLTTVLVVLYLSRGLITISVQNTVQNTRSVTAEITHM